MNASVLGMILAVAACFTAAVLNLAVESRFRSAVMRTAILLAVFLVLLLAGVCVRLLCGAACGGRMPAEGFLPHHP